MPKGRTWVRGSKLESGWKPAVVDGKRGWRIGNWLTWFDEQQGWLWMWKP